MSRLLPVQRIARPNNSTYKLLTGDALKAHLQARPSWKYTEKLNESMKSSISREFKFKNFLSTRAFVQDVFEAADKYDHHPELRNVYTTVNIVYNTHDVGGLTELDFKLAEETDKAYKNALDHEDLKA